MDLRALSELSVCWVLFSKEGPNSLPVTGTGFYTQVYRAPEGQMAFRIQEFSNFRKVAEFIYNI